MSKTKTFEETKRVSNSKGFLGYKNNNSKIIISNIDRVKLIKLSKEQIEAIVKKISCDYPHQYPLLKLQLGIK